MMLLTEYCYCETNTFVLIGIMITAFGLGCLFGYLYVWMIQIKEVKIIGKVRI